jgi:hypothetical protein
MVQIKRIGSDEGVNNARLDDWVEGIGLFFRFQDAIEVNSKQICNRTASEKEANVFNAKEER